MRTVAIQPTFEAWRQQARELLQHGVPPEEVCWEDATRSAGLLQEESTLYAASPISFQESQTIKVPPEFLSLARQVCAHTDERRFAVLYRLLHRMTRGGQRHLLGMPSDPDTNQCQRWAKAVGREIHKMHAYVRFRLVGTCEESGREQFVAWFEPEFRIVRLAAPFFEKRFVGMDWSILTPDECVIWDGKTLLYLPGMRREDAPGADAHDDLWRTYYRSIFNPARLKVQAMQSSMPQKYWKNMPETQIISELIATSQKRVQGMLDTPERPVKPMPDNAYLRSLRDKQAP